MNLIVGDRVKELVEAVTDLTVDERIYATKTGAVVVLTQEGWTREEVERYRRSHKARRLGL